VKRALVVFLIIFCMCVSATAQAPTFPTTGASSVTDFVAGLRNAIDKNLGRPYVWGATGLKSYDCSG
jgi:cell wall-associated NlpC family hydrolase